MISVSYRFLRGFLSLLLVLMGIATLVFLGSVAYVVSHFSGTASFPVDCALVMGAAVHGADEPGPGIRRRVRTASDLYYEENVQKVFLSGGQGSSEQASEAAVMKKVAMQNGVDIEDIILEETATSTWENLENSRALMSDCTSSVAISDRYHLARIGFIARKQGWDDLQTFPAIRTSSSVFEVRSTVREAFGILYYVVNRPSQ